MPTQPDLSIYADGTVVRLQITGEIVKSTAPGEWSVMVRLASGATLTQSEIADPETAVNILRPPLENGRLYVDALGAVYRATAAPDAYTRVHRLLLADGTVDWDHRSYGRGGNEEQIPLRLTPIEVK
jgi:hypothetical protein